VENSAKKYIGAWLIIGLVMVFIQVMIGGITRLTDSGLSITEWEVVKGVIPPTNEDAWNIAFEKYQTHARTQFENIHSDMTLSEFKVIYFWEWFHRLWGRIMGLVFFFPFLFFAFKKWIPKWLYIRFVIMIFLAALAATFGWIMVASGLNNDNRTWVSAYKLAIHLMIATILFGYIFWTILLVKQEDNNSENLPKFKKIAVFITSVVILQIVFGAFMAGMRAGVIHTHWPFFLGGNNLYHILIQDATQLSSGQIINYEDKVWIKAVVQVVHRFLAFALLVLSGWYLYSLKTFSISSKLKKANLIMLFFLIIQYLLGVFTVINISGGKVPVGLGAIHQLVALLLLASWLNIVFKLKTK
jgi:cytochrome c oxidase assembly protein subunit 15